MIRARKAAKKTQEDVAKAMHTNTSAVGRLEMSGGKRHHSPSLATLRRYAHAVGCKEKHTVNLIFFDNSRISQRGYPEGVVLRILQSAHNEKTIKNCLTSTKGLALQGFYMRIGI